MATQNQNPTVSNAIKRKRTEDERLNPSVDAAETDTWPRFIVLSSRDEGKNISKINPFILEKTITGIAGEVKNVKKLNSGILIECLRKQQSDNLLSLKKVGDLNIISSPHKSLNQCKGIVRYRHGDLDELSDQQRTRYVKA